MHRRTRARLSLGVSTLTLFAALAAQPVFAQDEAMTVLDTVFITGEKVRRDLKSTASSVVVTTAEELARQKPGKDNVTDVVNGTPNLVYPDNSSAPVIRGVDAQGPNNGAVAFFGGTVPRATINIDGHYLSYNEFIYGATAVWDLEGIEVFRGPQTTSQGANAIAGAIVVNTKDPTFTPEGAYRLEAGNYKARKASLAWGGPISGDIAARFSLDYSARDTFITYPNTAFYHDGTDQNLSSKTARAKFLWVPAGIDGLEAKLTLSHSQINRPTYEAASAPFDKLEHAANTMPNWDQSTSTAVLDVNYDFGNGFRLLNQTQFSDSESHRRIGIVNGGDADINMKNVSNETRLSFGEIGSIGFSGVAGLFVNHTESDETLYLTGRFGTVSTFDDKKTNVGLFTEATWQIDNQWALTGGLRYQRDHIQRKGQSVYAATGVAFDETFSKVLPKLTLSYAATPDWTVGATVGKGYNPGGVSLNLTTGNWAQFKEETSTNYELFARANLLGDRLFLTGNLFYTDLRNAQYNIGVEIAPGTYQSYTINAEKAKSYGLELGLDYKPTDTLTLRASAGLLKTEIKEMSSRSEYEGNEFARAPGHTLMLGANWQVNDRLTLGGQIRQTGGYFSDTPNTPLFSIDSYTVADVNASWKLRDNLEFYGYVNNLFDQRKPVSKQNNRGIGGLEASMTSPRMIGIGIRGTF